MENSFRRLTKVRLLDSLSNTEGLLRIYVEQTQFGDSCAAVNPSLIA